MRICRTRPRACSSWSTLHDSLRAAAVDFRIIRDVTGKGRFARWEDVAEIDDLEAATVFYRPPVVDPDVLTVLHDFEEEGHFIGVVTATINGDDKVHRAVFPFEVGYTGFGYWPLILLLLLAIQIQYLVMSGRFRKGRAGAAAIIGLAIVPVQDVAAETWTSQRGIFSVSYESALDPIEINRIHSWVLSVSRDGEPVEGAVLVVDGGMPEHDHGLPTAPRITADLGDGRYRLEGYAFPHERLLGNYDRHRIRPNARYRRNNPRLVSKTFYWLVAALLAVLLFAATRLWSPPPGDWTPEELQVIRSLWIASLPELPPDSGNPIADDPRAVDLGHELFFSTALSPSGAIACATCHRPELRFTDGMQKGRGVGQSRRNTMSIVGSAYSPWQYWDGRRDSQWAQALSPIEDPAEHGGNRRDAVGAVAEDSRLREQYVAIFGELPDLDDAAGVDRAFANIGKAIAAYERRIMPGPALFDNYAAALLEGDGETAAELYTNDQKKRTQAVYW